MVDPSDFPKNDPPREGHEQEMLKPEKSVKVVAGIFAGGVIVLVVMLVIALVVL